MEMKKESALWNVGYLVWTLITMFGTFYSMNTTLHWVAQSAGKWTVKYSAIQMYFVTNQGTYHVFFYFWAPILAGLIYNTTKLFRAGIVQQGEPL